jgi:GT2 family glycosyltransferase
VEKLQEVVAEPLPTFFASGGFMALKAGLFRRLGGFDPLFEPFYYEDVDLSYRAWKRGWRVLFHPRSVVVHHHRKGSILAHYDDGRVQTVMQRNRFLFTWKNVTSPQVFWVRHLLPLLLRTLLKLFVLDLRFYRALVEALGRLRQVREGRRREKRGAVKNDREIFRMIREVAPPGVR